jgi:hypothetical protein
MDVDQILTVTPDLLEDLKRQHAAPDLLAALKRALGDAEQIQLTFET